MSYYDTRDSRGYRVKRDRYSRPGGYVEETYVDNRGGYGRELGPVRRPDDSSESVVEEVTRDSPPGEYYYGYPRPRRAVSVRESGTRRARSAGRDPYYDDDYYRRDEYRPRRHRHRPDKRDRYERRSSYSSSRSPSPRPRRRKSLSEQAVGAIGGALGIKSARDRSRDRYEDRYDDRYADRGRRRHHRSYSDSRSRSRGDHRAKSEARIAQAVKAALAAGAAEAFRARKDPGPWTGEKGRRILTAAISAGGVDGLIDRDPNKHGGRHVIESVLAGMATNRFVNGERSRSRSRGRSQSRARSQSQGGLKDMASAGILAAAGKQIYDRVRSKSRGRSRSHSQDSYSDDRGHGDSKRRGSSVSRAINKGIAALGLDDKKKDDRRQDRSSRYSDYSDSEDDDDSYRSSRRRHRSSRDVRSQPETSRPSTSRALQRGNSSNGKIVCHSDCDSDSDLGSSDEEKRQKKKMLRRELVSSGLAAVATIHAAHSVAKNFEAQKKRRQAVSEGAISKEQELKMKRKANLRNVASVGLAALGIQGAVSEWKEVHEQRKEHKEFEHKCEERHRKRLLRRTQSLDGSRSSGNQSMNASAANINMNGHGGSHYYDGNPYNTGYSFDYQH